MSNRDVADALQAINAGIDGIKNTPTRMPGFLDAASLPTTLVYPADAEHTGHTFNDLRSWRTWIIRLYVQKIGAGDVDDGYQRTLPYLTLFRDAYTVATRQGNDAWCSAEYTTDTGVLADMTLHGMPMELAGTDVYWGAEFRIRIMTRS